VVDISPPACDNPVMHSHLNDELVRERSDADITRAILAAQVLRVNLPRRRDRHAARQVREQLRAEVARRAASN
jgi:hypothetical protein